MASSSRWGSQEAAALRRVTLWAGDRPLPLGEERGTPVPLSRGDLYSLNLRYPAGELEPGELSLLVDFDPALGGVAVPFYTREPGLRQAEQEPMHQLAGQRFVGDSTVALCYRGEAVAFALAAVRFEPDAVTLRHYDFMRRALEQENGLVLDFYGLTRIWAEWNAESSGEEAPANLQLFELVRWAAGRMLPVLRRISQQPLRDLEQVEERAAVGQAGGRLNAAAFRRAATDGTVWAPVSLPGVHSLPERVTVLRQRETFATPENAFLREFARDLATHARQLQGLARAEAARLNRLVDERYGTWKEQTRQQLARLQRGLELMRGLEAQLNGLLEEPFLRHGAPAGTGAPSHRLVGQPLYRQVWRTAQQFRWGLRLGEQLAPVEALPLRTRSINALYEYWLAAVIHRTLVDSLGFEPVRRNGRLLELDRAMLNAVVAEGSAVEFALPGGVTCTLAYGKRYPMLRYDDEALVGADPAVIGGRIQKKDAPDLVLEFSRPGEPVPVIVTIDATFTSNPELLEKKSYYLETIRSRAFPGQPEWQWGYPVAEAWAVYPGTHRTPVRPRGFNGGEFGLLPEPGAEGDLAEWLRGIVSRVAGV